MLRKTRSKRELEIENAYLKTQRLRNNTVTIGQTLIKWAGIVCCFKYISVAISALAGKETSANLVLDILASASFSVSVSIVFGLGGVAYGLSQRSLRIRNILRLSGRVAELEAQIDPGRSSSGISSDGRTNEGDQI